MAKGPLTGLVMSYKGTARCFDVERIMGRRFTHGREEYLVKWVGFDEDQSTWEPVTNLLNVIEMLEAFNSQAGHPSGKGLRGRSKPPADKDFIAGKSTTQLAVTVVDGEREAGEDANAGLRSKQTALEEDLVTVVVAFNAPQVTGHKWVDGRLLLMVAPNMETEELLLLSHAQAREKIPAELCDYYSKFISKPL